MKHTYLRSLNQLDADHMWPGVAYQNQRVKAVYEVLRIIPEDVYQKLRGMYEIGTEAFFWFIPGPETHGMVFLRPATNVGKIDDPEAIRMKPYAKIIYLNPKLEHSAWTIVVAVVAHELAHIVLEHSLFRIRADECEFDEQEVFQLICSWGFQHEAKLHRAMVKRKESQERIRREMK